MELEFLIRGIVVGFSIAAPVGQIGILCIRRTLERGRLQGLVSGLGAATADAFYGAVAAFGITSVSSALISQQFLLRLIGGLFLLYLGVRTFIAVPRSPVSGAVETRWLGAYASTFLLTLTNPTTILSFAAIFMGVGLGAAGGDLASACLLITGVFTGSAVWWFLLSWVVSIIGARLGPAALGWINKGSGLLIACLGALTLASLFL